VGGNPFANSFRDLIVYQKAREVAKKVFVITQSFPSEEKYFLTDQWRRSSRSVGAQIAEAWAKRRYPNHFITKLTDSDGEQNETRHWVETATDCGYLSSASAQELNNDLQAIGRMLQSMMNRANDFKGVEYSRVKEPSANYGSINEFFAIKTEN